MITSQLFETADTQPDVPFPSLLRCLTRPSLVVLFTAPDAGTVVAVGDDEPVYFVGDHQDDWDGTRFTAFKGRLTLSNELDAPAQGGDDEDAERWGFVGDLFSAEPGAAALADILAGFRRSAGAADVEQLLKALSQGGPGRDFVGVTARSTAAANDANAKGGKRG